MPKATRAQADFPSGSPWVTSVGGTTLALDRHGDYAWETSMGDGLSVLTDKGKACVRCLRLRRRRGCERLPAALVPARQRSGGTAHRTTPDVALEGDGALPGVLVGLTDAGAYHLVGFGGTSAAAPAFAAVQADAQQASGHRLGFANPLLYALARSRAHVFHDVTDRPANAGAQPLTVVRDEGPAVDTSRAHSAISSTPSATTSDSRPAAATTTPPASAPPTPATCAGSSTPRAR